MNVYGAAKGPYYQMQFAVANALPRLSGNAAKVIILLAAMAHRHNAVELELSQSDIASGTGIKDRKTINKAMGELETARLVRVRPSLAGVLSYILLDAATWEPLPKPERYSGVRRYRQGRIQDGEAGNDCGRSCTSPG